MVKRKTKNVLILFILFALTVICLTLYWLKWEIVPPSHSSAGQEPPLEVHPINQQVQFIQANTSLSLHSKKGDNYTILLHTQSETSEVASLRQDIALLFGNGVLLDSIYGWKREEKYFEQEQLITGKGSARYDIMTYHHAQFEGDSLTSQQAISHDQVYILGAAFTSNSFFREAITNTQKQWQRILDLGIKEQIDYQKEHLLSFFQINQKEYQLIPFDQLSYYGGVAFPSFSMEQTENLLGIIWSILFQYYLTGVTPVTSEASNPKGSSMPMILIAHDHSHLKVLFRTKSGKEVQIVHQIERI